MNNLLASYQNNFVTAYRELQKSGLLNDEIIQRHIEQQSIVDRLLPESASFFYVTELPAYKYHFMGRQQPSVSGYTNEEFLTGGLELFMQSVHPEDVNILFNRLYTDYFRLMVDVSSEERQKLQFQYNYRFKRKNGEMLNLMEQMYAIELDDAGVPSLILGNVIIIGHNEQLPVRATAKLITESGFTETVFAKTYGPIANEVESLTNRELDILKNLATGKTSKEIGDALYISPHTVDTHRRNLLRKLKCRSVVELSHFAFKHSLL